MPIRKSLNQDFFKKWSPEMAYVLGFFTADGCMTRNKRGAHFIEFQITDKDILEKIKKLFGSNHKIAERNRDRTYKIGYRLQIGSKEIFNDLINIGLTPRKSLTLKMVKIPDCFLSNFVRGYFDGDGCVSLGRYWKKDRNKFHWEISSRFTSGSRIFLEKLLRVLRKVANIKGGFIINKIGSYDLVFSRHDSLALFRFMYNNKKDLFLERKYNIFKRGFKNLNLGT